MTTWNLLIFAIISDLDEELAMARALADMRAGITGTSCRIGVKLVAATGMTQHWITSADKTASTPVQGPADASDPGCLTQFLKDAAAHLGAASTALVVYAHGSGLDDIHDYLQEHGRWPASRPHTWPPHYPLRLPRPYRLGPDPTTHQFLSNVGLRDAILASDTEIAVLGLNACWMAAFEIEHELRNACSVAVASQVFAQTWPYGTLVKAMCDQPPTAPEDLGRLIVHTVQDELDVGMRDDGASACRTRLFDALQDAFDKFASAAIPLITSDWSGVKNALQNKVMRVDDPSQVDLRSLLTTLGKGHADASAKAKQALGILDEVVIANAPAWGPPGPTGLSVLCPNVSGLDVDAAYVGLDVANKAWSQFLKKYLAALAGP